ncbi:DUF7009 family protein [Hymenobacter psychrotolerans]|uniref:Uncharacterized protein n=1 Tax=Hymenobacter psychrotolerans DSM 18569 TaxID=1121959 RepID=A0A1M7CKU7_9BACT|nr:hypothetical protein [Hymenobacter psychrotolerans]SHL67449.1 hypothetical protein SAMN02746009_03185 [Hymenobacter psychrotolerans DSM 18569]
MKLRLEDNTLRLRLSAEEVADFGRTGQLQTVVPLGPAALDTLTYVLVRAAGLGGLELQLAYSPGHITVQVPAAVADEWTASETISLRCSYPVAGNQVLHILVEKDLGCKH